jgi:hypothetical protein
LLPVSECSPRILAQNLRKIQHNDTEL